MDPKQITSERAEIVEEVVGFSIRKLWFTIKELTIRPGTAMADYCDGNRKAYIPPITYFLLTWSVTYFLVMSTGVMDFSFNMGHTLAGGDGTLSMANPVEDIIKTMRVANPEMSEEDLQKFADAVGGSFGFLNSRTGLLLLILPVFLPLQWLFFRKFRKPFTHHLYFYLYTSAHLNLLSLPVLALGYFVPAVALLMMAVVTIASFFYFYYIEFIFYRGITVQQLILRNIVALAVSIIPFTVWFILLWGITFIIYLKWM